MIRANAGTAVRVAINTFTAEAKNGGAHSWLGKPSPSPLPLVGEGKHTQFVCRLREQPGE
jgi:hypothetical protein